MAEIKVGDKAPDFETTTDKDEKVKLSDYLGKRVVLYFYPRDDTPGCTRQACGFRDSYADIEAQGALVLGVSPDNEVSHRKFKEKFSLPFTLLVDLDHAVAERYGAWGEKQNYGRKYMGIIRSHVVVGEDGRLLDVQIQVSPEDSVARALSALAG